MTASAEPWYRPDVEEVARLLEDLQDDETLTPLERLVLRAFAAGDTDASEALQTCPNLLRRIRNVRARPRLRLVKN